jgi:hypothetical protein
MSDVSNKASMHFWRNRLETFLEVPMVLHFIFWELWLGIGVWCGYLIWGA